MMFGGVFALYQMTSLVLGPAVESRQLPLSISAPAVELDDLSEPVITNVKLVLGALAGPAASPVDALPAPPHAVIKPAAVSTTAPAVVKPIVVPPAPPIVASTAEPATHPVPSRVKPVAPAVPIVDGAGD